MELPKHGTAAAMLEVVPFMYASPGEVSVILVDTQQTMIIASETSCGVSLTQVPMLQCMYIACFRVPGLTLF